MTAFQANRVYLFAAGHGHCPAQSDMALAFRNHAETVAEDDPGLADEYFTASEMFAELACTHARPHDAAVLASVFVARSLHLVSRDPVRSLEYREEAETLFDSVESTADSHALGIVSLSLNRLADADPDDDRASVRLNRIIDALPTAEAQLLREAARARSGAAA